MVLYKWPQGPHLFAILWVWLCCPVVFPDSEWPEWGIDHRAFGVPPPHSTLLDLHYPAFAFPPYALLLLPEQPLLRPPLTGRRLSTNQFRKDPQESGENHRGGISGLIAVPGVIELKCEVSQTKSSTCPTRSEIAKISHHLIVMLYPVLGKILYNYVVVFSNLFYFRLGKDEALYWINIAGVSGFKGKNNSGIIAKLL